MEPKPVPEAIGQTIRLVIGHELRAKYAFGYLTLLAYQQFRYVHKPNVIGNNTHNYLMIYSPVLCPQMLIKS